jgi:hypothetical protein
MSTFTEHQIEEFNQELYAAAQHKGEMMRPRVRRKTGVVGYRTHFPRIGVAPAAMPKTPNGKVPRLNIARTREFCDLLDFYGSDVIDDLAELITNVQQRTATQDAITWSLARREDDIAKDELATGANANDLTASNETYSSDAVPRNILEFFGNAELMDGQGMHAVVTWRAWNALLALNSFINSDFGGDPMLTSEGQRPKQYFGFSYVPWSRLPQHSGGDRYNLWFNQRVICVAVGAEITTRTDYLPDEDAHQIMGKMRMGGCLVDDLGVIKRRYA